MKVFLITVESHAMLAEEIRETLRGSELTVVNQFDLRNVDSLDALKHVDRGVFERRYGALPSKGAIGCAMAHRYCYRQLLESGDEYALVLEDDVIAETIDPMVIGGLLASGLKFDVLNLGSRDAVVARQPALKVGGHNVHRCLHYSHETHAYLLSRSGARKLVAAQTPLIRGWADYPEHPWLMKFYVVSPRFIGLSDRPTGVQTKPATRSRASLFNRAAFRARRLIWLAIGWFRTQIMNDLIISGDHHPSPSPTLPRSLHR